MSYRIFLLALCLILYLKVSIASEGGEIHDQLPDDYGMVGYSCNKVWGDLMDEWRRNGGGILGSLHATREQISSDNKSKFSRIVKEIWMAQRDSGHGRRLSELGSWPISDSDHLDLMESSYAVLQREIPISDCGVLVWLQSKILMDISDGDDDGNLRRLVEVPGSIRWESPWAQQWVEYWIFVFIK